MIDAFISYGTPNRESAENLFSFLDTHGFKPWMDKKNLIPGVKWKREILKSLENCDVVIFLLSSETVNRRGFFQREMNVALDRALDFLEKDIFIIPVRLNDCETPDKLSDYQYADCFDDDWSVVLSSLRLAAEQRGVDLRARVDRPVVIAYEEINEKGVAYKFSSKFPKLEYPSSGGFAETVGNIIRGEVSEMLLDFKRTSKEDFNPKISDYPSELRIEVSTELINSKIISLQKLIYWFGSGAAHGHYGSTAMNLDLHQATKFSAQDLFSDPQPIIAQIRDEILCTDESPIIEKDEVPKVIEDALKNKTWFNERFLTVHFDPYEIFCYAHGSFDIKLPSSEVLERYKDYLTEYGKDILISTLPN